MAVLSSDIHQKGDILTSKQLLNPRATEQALRHDIERYRRMVETAQDGVMVFDADARLAFINPRLAEMLGYAAGEMVGSLLTTFLVMDGEVDYETRLERHRFGIAEESEFLFRRRDGSTFWTLVRSNPLFNGEGEYQGARAQVIDTSALKRAEAEVTRLNELLERENAALEERIHERTSYMEEFVATVSHEFRTPLTSVRGYLDLVLADEDLSIELQQRYLNRVVANVQHLTVLLNNLLDLSRLTAGNFQVDLRPVAIVDLLTQVQGGLRPEFETKNVQLLVDCACPSDFTMLSDSEALTRILSNLLSNACKYTPDGGKTTLRVGSDGDTLWLTVADTGMGIPAGEQYRVFTRFYRGGNSRKLPVKGTGLGLAITKSLVDLLGGEITFTSAEGVGTTFRLVFPLKPVLE